MSRSTEALVRAALTARTEQVTYADLTQQLAPPTTSPRRWAVPLAAAATVAAAVLGVWLVTGPGTDRAVPPAEAPTVSTELSTVVTTAPADPAPTASQPAPPPTTTKPPPPSTPAPNAPTTRRVTFGVLSLDVPIQWTTADGWEGDTACVGPAADPCSGVRAAAAGERVTVEDYFRDDSCRRSGPTQVELDHLTATRGDYDCGEIRYLWVLDPDPFYSVGVMTETLSREQLAVVESVRLTR